MILLDIFEAEIIYLNRYEAVVWTINDDNTLSVKLVLRFNYNVSLEQAKADMVKFHPDEQHIEYRLYRRGGGWRHIDGFNPHKPPAQ